MEISYAHRFIFIRVYKTGSDSVRQALWPYAWSPNRYLIRVPLVRKFGRTGVHRLRDHRAGHIKAKELQTALPAEVFDEFFKFSFVRNTWEWHVSTYHYLKERTNHPDHAVVASMRDFEEFLDWRVHGLGAEQQREFVLSDEGELLVDYVGHFDSLADHFATVCARIGIDASLPHVNKSSHRDFRQYYTPASRALVAEAWKGDIEFFGFDFDKERKLEPVVKS